MSEPAPAEKKPRPKWIATTATEGVYTVHCVDSGDLGSVRLDKHGPYCLTCGKARDCEHAAAIALLQRRSRLPARGEFRGVA